MFTLTSKYFGCQIVSVKDFFKVKDLRRSRKRSKMDKTCLLVCVIVSLIFIAIIYLLPLSLRETKIDENDSSTQDTVDMLMKQFTAMVEKINSDEKRSWTASVYDGAQIRRWKDAIQRSAAGGRAGNAGCMLFQAF